MVTAQYFVWYFCLLPLVLPHIAWPPPSGLVWAAAAWLAVQLHWLAWAYSLEFQVCACGVGGGREGEGE